MIGFLLLLGAFVGAFLIYVRIVSGFINEDHDK